jgi:hypothetical protein
MSIDARGFDVVELDVMPWVADAVAVRSMNERG